MIRGAPLCLALWLGLAAAAPATGQANAPATGQVNAPATGQANAPATGQVNAPATDSAAARALVARGCKSPRWHTLGGDGWLADCASMGKNERERHRLFVVRGARLQPLTRYQENLDARVPWHFELSVAGARVTVAARTEFGDRYASTWDAGALPARLTELRGGGDQTCRYAQTVGGNSIALGALEVRAPICVADFDQHEERCTRYSADCKSFGRFAGRELRAIPRHDARAPLRASLSACAAGFGSDARRFEVVAIDHRPDGELQLHLRAGVSGGRWELWLAATSGRGSCDERFDETCHRLQGARPEHYVVAPARIAAAPGSRATLAKELQSASNGTTTTLTLRGAAYEQAHEGGITVGYRDAAGLVATSPVDDGDPLSLGLLGDEALCDAPADSDPIAPDAAPEDL